MYSFIHSPATVCCEPEPSYGKKQEGNMYDKIFKENLLEIFIPIVAKRLSVTIKHLDPLPEKIQTTVERETDCLLRIESRKGKKFILHLEFQTRNQAEMIYRVGEYHGMIQRKYKLPVKHMVIYLGEEKVNMRNELEEEEIYSGFELIDTKSLDYTKSLSSQVPEEIILAILGNYPKGKSEAVIRLISARLRKVCKSPNDLSKYINQLIIISRLRKLEESTIQILSEMPILYDIETDGLYLMGLAKNKEETEKAISKAKAEAEAKEKAEKQVEQMLRHAVIALHKNTHLSIKQISAQLNVSEEKVRVIIDKKG